MKKKLYAPHACSIFIDSLKANVSLNQERIKSVCRAAASPIHETGV